MTKQQMLQQMTELNATLKVTFKLPLVARRKNEAPSRLSVKDVDFIETEILRQFFINTQRIVDFDFYAYAEDKAKDDDQNFVGLHYHAVVRSENDAKFIAVAPKKYEAVLRNRFEQFQTDFVMPKEPLFIAPLSKVSNSDDLLEADSYEQYCLKHYEPSLSLVSSTSYRIKRLAA
jgi:hypothetical protein